MKGFVRVPTTLLYLMSVVCKKIGIGLLCVVQQMLWKQRTVNRTGLPVYYNEKVTVGDGDKEKEMREGWSFDKWVKGYWDSFQQIVWRSHSSNLERMESASFCVTIVEKKEEICVNVMERDEKKEMTIIKPTAVKKPIWENRHYYVQEEGVKSTEWWIGKDLLLSEKQLQEYRVQDQ